jgi:hypothetical protein
MGNGNARRKLVLPASPLSFSFDSSSRGSPSRELDAFLGRSFGRVAIATRLEVG